MTWETTMQSTYNAFLGGNITQSSIAVYTNIMGLWFYLLILLLTMVMIYMRTQNFVVTALTGMVVSGAVMVLLPESASMTINVMVALGIFIILYRLYHK